MSTTYSPRDIDVVLRDGSSVRIRAAHPEMDCNPVIVLPEGAVIVDARIRIEASQA